MIARLAFPAYPAQAIEPRRIEADRLLAEFHGSVLAWRAAAADGFDGIDRHGRLPYYGYG